jgi:signal transduction histidine kinase
MRNLILDLLDLTKIESGKKQRSIEKINLSEIIQHAIATMQPYAIQKDISVEANASEKVFINADSEEMEIVLNNLLSNAIKYNKKGGRVVISLTENEHEIIISVKDTGIGISEEDQKQLFREFVRIKNEQTRRISGSGLGLSIVKRIIDNYKASINLESELNKGSTFYITFNK